MMRFLIPTAKEMKTPERSYPQNVTPKTEKLLQVMASLSTDELVKAYKIKEEAAQKEYQRWQKMAQGQAETYPAISLFNGLMYRIIKRDNLSTSEENYLETRVLITSSFYGVIPAFYPIAEHRHDFHTKVKIQGQSLKTYWRPAYDEVVEGLSGPVISLLSNEFEEVFSPNIRQNFVTVNFMEEREGKLKTHSTISKKARGAFLTAAMESDCRDVEDLRQLGFADFSYREDLSTAQKLVFVKKV